MLFVSFELTLFISLILPGAYVAGTITTYCRMFVWCIWYMFVTDGWCLANGIAFNSSHTSVNTVMSDFCTEM